LVRDLYRRVWQALATPLGFGGEMFRRVAVAAVALTVGVATAVGLLAYTALIAGSRPVPVAPARTEAADALVAMPIKDLPPVRAGDRVDLFALTGGGDHLSAQPFAWSVRVAAVSADGLILHVPSRLELAFVYAAAALRMAAVLTTASVPPAGAAPITSPEQALAAVVN
jgi:hypothetical protein